MIRINYCKRVINALRLKGYKTNEASPNVVAWFAYNEGFKLNSDEVVYISDTYKG